MPITTEFMSKPTPKAVLAIYAALPIIRNARAGSMSPERALEWVEALLLDALPTEGHD